MQMEETIKCLCENKIVYNISQLQCNENELNLLDENAKFNYIVEVLLNNKNKMYGQCLGKSLIFILYYIGRQIGIPVLTTFYESLFRDYGNNIIIKVLCCSFQVLYLMNIIKYKSKVNQILLLTKLAEPV